jgi:hypothetical protein
VTARWRGLWLLALVTAASLAALVLFRGGVPPNSDERAAEPLTSRDPPREPTRKSVAVQVANPPPAAGAPAPDAERLLRELEPLAVTDKPRALALALAADETLPAQGVMAEARRALIVTLMVDTDRMSDARERARAFIRQYPESRYLPIVKGTTGVHPRPRPSEAPGAGPP